jgi:hypothetical protein
VTGVAVVGIRGHLVPSRPTSAADSAILSAPMIAGHQDRLEFLG